MEKPRILITGFGAFPGAPHNPTDQLVARLLRLRRPAFDNIERIGHVFPVSYSAVDRELPQLIAAHRPHALLCFGLAARTPFVRIETRARNTVTQIWPDAAQTRVRHRSIESNTDSTRRFGPHTLRLLRVAQNSGIDARASLSAGYYLCNYLSWRAIEATRVDHAGNQNASGNPAQKNARPNLAAFIHVPLVPRGPVSARPKAAARITFEHLVDAGEAILMEMARLTRRATII